MNLGLNIVLIVGPLVLGTYLSTLNIPIIPKIIIWIICLFICFCGVYKAIKEKKEEEKEAKNKGYYHQLQERQELYARGLPIPYINGLGENPLLEHFFNEGQKYEEKSKFKKAIEEYKKCLSHPKATEENKVAANVFIGNCYHALSGLKEAEKYYKEALKISKRVKDRSERLRGRSAALGNIGLIYQDLGKPEEALKYHKEALEIFKCIGAQPEIKIVLKNINIIEEEKRKRIDWRNSV